MEISKQSKTEFTFKIALKDGAVYIFTAIAETEDEAKQKVRDNLLEAANQLNY